MVQALAKPLDPLRRVDHHERMVVGIQKRQLFGKIAEGKKAYKKYAIIVG